jgi:hypothetical protein
MIEGDKAQITGFENIDNGDIGIVSNIQENGFVKVENFSKESMIRSIIFRPEHLRLV